MTGVEALQALRDGKKVTNSSMEGSYFAYVIEYELGGKSYRRVAWVGYERVAWVGDWEDEYDPLMWCNGDPVDTTDFLRDDWEIVE